MTDMTVTELTKNHTREGRVAIHTRVLTMSMSAYMETMFGGMMHTSGGGGYQGGRGRVIGMIQPDAERATKAKKYVQLLYKEDDWDSDEDEVVLIGEPALWTRPLYGYNGHFHACDLEYFAAFAGLIGIVQAGGVSDVLSALRSKPKALDTLCHWLYETPWVGEEADEEAYDILCDEYDFEELRRLPQHHPFYFHLVIATPLRLLACIVYSDFSRPSSHNAKTVELRECTSALIAGSKQLPGLIQRLAELSCREFVPLPFWDHSMENGWQAVTDDNSHWTYPQRVQIMAQLLLMSLYKYPNARAEIAKHDEAARQLRQCGICNCLVLVSTENTPTQDALGQEAVILNLEKAMHLNGKVVLVNEWLHEKQRYCVQPIGDVPVVNVKPENLHIWGAASSTDPRDTGSKAGDLQGAGQLPPGASHEEVTRHDEKSHPTSLRPTQAANDANTHCSVPHKNKERTIQKCAACSLPGKKMKKCSGCRLVSYCSRECQKEHWKMHKENCFDTTK
ncbi:hypothetical protein CYMTET_20191 [Cymbomonas tetramitiformis]|uniref:MYND-type domain-containing protein n=1 Tax=Cymbomonas tetramitiformis TaxID=36881 RepID=A0AAE0L4J2_9CHLO|nr:hypothetical protein CYMTET_20191 [Cymbomonas tetramitiformis]